MNPINEAVAANILRVAINRGRAAELIWCLFEGGAVTLDPASEDLVMVPGDVFKAWVEEQS